MTTHLKIILAISLLVSVSAFGSTTTSSTNPIPAFIRDTVHIQGSGTGSGHMEIIYDSNDTFVGPGIAVKAVDHLYYFWAYCTNSSGGIPTQWRWGVLYFVGTTVTDSAD